MEMVPETSDETDVGDAPLVGSLSDIRNVESPKTELDRLEDRRVGVRDAQDPPEMGSLGVEDSSEEPLAPRVSQLGRPGNQLHDGVHAGHRLVPDGVHPLIGADGLLEYELARRNAAGFKEGLGADKAFDIGEGEAEAMDEPIRTSRPRVLVGPDAAVTADHAGEVAEPVVDIVIGCWSESPRSHEFVVDGEMRAAVPAALRTGH